MENPMFGYMEIHGSSEACHAFVEGFQKGRGEKHVYFARETGIELPTFLDRIATGLRREVHMVASLDFLTSLSGALEGSSRCQFKPD